MPYSITKWSLYEFYITFYVKWVFHTIFHVQNPMLYKSQGLKDLFLVYTTKVTDIIDWPYCDPSKTRNSPLTLGLEFRAIQKLMVAIHELRCSSDNGCKEIINGS